MGLITLNSSSQEADTFSSSSSDLSHVLALSVCLATELLGLQEQQQQQKTISLNYYAQPVQGYTRNIVLFLGPSNKIGFISQLPAKKEVLRDLTF